MTEPRYRTNTELTAAKLFDDEAVVINVATGRYYDLEGVGAAVWTLLGGGASVAQIAAAVGEGYDVAPEVALADLEPMIADLLAEGLIVGEEDEAVGGTPPTLEPGSRPYAAPELVTYTDMEDLLAADPPMPTAYTPTFSAPPPPPA